MCLYGSSVLILIVYCRNLKGLTLRWLYQQSDLLSWQVKLWGSPGSGAICLPAHQVSGFMDRVCESVKTITLAWLPLSPMQVSNSPVSVFTQSVVLVLLLSPLSLWEWAEQSGDAMQCGFTVYLWLILFLSTSKHPKAQEQRGKII